MAVLLDPTLEETFGETLTKYAKVALALNRFPEKKVIPVDALAEEADVHWNTAKKALLFFYKIKPIMPDLVIEENSKFTVFNKPTAMESIDTLFSSLEMRITTKMLLSKMTSKRRGLKKYELSDLLEKIEIEKIHKLIEKGLVNSEEGYYYLSSKGIILGNIGVKELTNLGIPLPWEESGGKIKKKLIYKTPFKTYQSYIKLKKGFDIDKILGYKSKNIYYKTFLIEGLKK